MHKPMLHFKGLALGCLISLAVVGCARNAVEPPQQVAEVKAQPQADGLPAPAPEIVAAAPEAAPMPPAAPQQPSTEVQPDPAPQAAAPVNDADPLPPRADRN